MSSTAPPSTARKRPRGLSDSIPAVVSMVPYETNGDGTGNETNKEVFDITTYVKTTVATDALRLEIKSLQAALEREKNLRILDRRKADQSDARLRRQVQFHLDEVEELQNSLEEERKQSEIDLKKATEAKNETLESLRDCERKLASLDGVEGGMEGISGGGGAREQLRRRCDLLESRLGARDEEIQSLRSSLRSADERVADAEERLSKRSSFSPPKEEMSSVEKGDFTSPPSFTVKGESSPSGASEVSKVRIKLAEAERTNRQLTRKLLESEKKARETVQHREIAKAAKSKADRMEEELDVLRREREEGRELELRWAEFRSELEKSFEKGDEQKTSSALTPQPPEIATVLRHFQKLKQKCLHFEELSSSLQSQLESSQRRVAALEQKMKNESTEMEQWQSEKRELERRVATSDVELGKIRAQEKIWQREADSLRSLLSTYENAHESSVGSDTKKRRFGHGDGGSGAVLDKEKGDDNDGPTSKGLRLSLDSAREQVDILTKRNNAASEELESSRAEIEKLKAEHERVLKKFKKLREALFQEREKADKAEDRACQAETLAGKGSFSSETTRVLHFQENPMMAAVRNKYETEIRALKDAIEEITAESSPKDVSSSSKTPPSGKKDMISSLDAQKLHQRLKQSFKEQIGMFREGVYLLTGYKVDMFVDSDRPRFKVRSMFAEREDDHLMFVWPKTKPGAEDSVTSLDMLDTELAQELSKTSSIQYITKFKSLPAFMSGVTLNLFEKQTFMG